MDIFKKLSFDKYKLEAGGFLLLLFCVSINIFPEGYVILGGDVLQPINMVTQFSTLFYEWFGRASLYYSIFYVLDLLTVSDSAQLSFYLGIFIIGSYFSFLAFAGLVFPIAAKITKVITAIFYATNIFTLYIFTSTWGYTNYQIIYIFVPLLSGLYIKILTTEGFRYLPFFFGAAFFASGSFSNPAFALVTGIFFLVLTVMMVVCDIVRIDRMFIKKIVYIVGGALLLNSYWILPLIPQVHTRVQEIYSSEYLDLDDSLRKNSNAIYDTIRFLPTNERSRYYPSNFPYPAISWMKQPLLAASFIPMILIMVGFFMIRDYKIKKWYAIFFSILLIFIALIARIRFPFDNINTYLFYLPGFNTLRGYDKFATFFPFIMSVPILLLGMSLQENKKRNLFLGGILLVTVFLSMPFYFGGIQTKMSYILSGQKDKDFYTSKQSALVKIPQDYLEIADYVKNDSSGSKESKISMLPYSPGSSVGRVNLPIWKVNGPHPAPSLYEKKYVELNDYYIPDWSFADDFENEAYDSEWISSLYGLLGIEYVFYHKDVKINRLEKMEERVESLIRRHIFTPLHESESFTLLKLSEDKLFPYLYNSNSDASNINLQPVGLVDAIHEFHTSINTVEYHIINKKEIEIPAASLEKDSSVFLNEKYDLLWNAVYLKNDGSRFVLKRNEGVKYANSWKIEENISDGSIYIYYKPVTLFKYGLLITGTSLVALIVYSFYFYRRKLSN
jgi:hypothetical protein